MQVITDDPELFEEEFFESLEKRLPPHIVFSLMEEYDQ